MLILVLLESWICYFWYWGKSGTSFTAIFSRHILAPRNETKYCLLHSLEWFFRWAYKRMSLIANELITVSKRAIAAHADRNMY